MCSAPKSSPGRKCRSAITIIPNTVDVGKIQNYLETEKLRGHILPLSHRSLKGQVKYNVLRSFLRALNTPGSTQL